MQLPQDITIVNFDIAELTPQQNINAEIIIVVKQSAGIRSILIDPSTYALKQVRRYKKYDLWMPITYFVIQYLEFNDINSMIATNRMFFSPCNSEEDISYIDENSSKLTTLNLRSSPSEDRFNIDGLYDKKIYLITPPLTNIEYEGTVCTPPLYFEHLKSPKQINDTSNPFLVDVTIKALNSFWDTPFANDAPGIIQNNSSCYEALYNAAPGTKNFYPDAHNLTAVLDFWEQATPEQLMTIFNDSKDYDVRL